VVPDELAIEGMGKRAVVIVGSQGPIFILQFQAWHGGIQDDTSESKRNLSGYRVRD
jgi:type II secretory pathway component PulJ